MNKLKKFTIFLVALSLLFSFFTIFLLPAEAKADDLIIEYNGAVTLVITDNSVLAATDTKQTTPVSVSPKPTTQPAPRQVVQVAPASSETKVKINPNTSTTASGDKKIKITIETTTPSTNQPKPATNPAPKTGQTPLPQAAPPPSAKTTTTEKTVDNVILRGADRQPVIIIKPDEKQNNNLNIQQPSVGTTTSGLPSPTVTTNLPVEIDAKSHKISVTTPDGGTKQVSVLPDQAVKGAEGAVIGNDKLPKAKEEVTLTQEKGQAIYVVNETRKGKIFGIEISLPSQVKISAETGKKVSAWQSLPSLILAPFLR